MTFIRSTVILVIVAIFGIALAKTITSVRHNVEEGRIVAKKLYDSFPQCKEELDLPGNNFSEFRSEIIANNVDDEKVGCALTCLATKVEYVKDDEIVNTKLMEDVNNVLNTDFELIVDFKDTVKNCITKTNDKMSQKKCKLIKGLFGCVLTDFKNGTAVKLISALASLNRQILLTKFTDINFTE